MLDVPGFPHLLESTGIFNWIFQVPGKSCKMSVVLKSRGIDLWFKLRNVDE